MISATLEELEAEYPALMEARLRIADLFEVPPDIPTSQYAEENVVLTSESSAEVGPWSNSRTPFLVEIMDSMSDPTVRQITLMFNSQNGKTSSFLNSLQRDIDLEPGPFMYVMPTLALAKAFSKERLETMLRTATNLIGKINNSKSRDGANEILHKKFLGGYLVLGGANSPSFLTYRSAKKAYLDEVDKYGMRGGFSGQEVIAKIKKRLGTFLLSQLVIASTPEIEGLSAITEEYEKSNKGKFHLPCVHCGVMDWLKFRTNLRWEEGKPWTAKYYCDSCSKLIDHVEKTWMMDNGKWIYEKPHITEHKGFWLNEMWSPWVTWGQMATEFEKVKTDPEKLKVFVNESLAEPWKIKGEAPDWERLYERREDYKIGIVPNDATLLVAGADVQKDRIEVEIVAYGKNLVSWSVEYLVIYTGPTDDNFKTELDALMNRTWNHESGTKMSLQGFAIDAGYEQNEVCGWAREWRHDSRVMAIRGVDRLWQYIGQPKKVDLDFGGKPMKSACKLWPVGVSKMKEELYRFLQQKGPKDGDPDPRGYCHFPRYDENYFKGLTAEQLITRKVKGYPKTEWEKIFTRNEPLDCRNYARAAAFRLGMDRWDDARWDEWRREVGIMTLEKNLESDVDYSSKSDNIREGSKPRRTHSKHVTGQ